MEILSQNSQKNPHKHTHFPIEKKGTEWWQIHCESRECLNRLKKDILTPRLPRKQIELSAESISEYVPKEIGETDGGITVILNDTMEIFHPFTNKDTILSPPQDRKITESTTLQRTVAATIDSKDTLIEKIQDKYILRRVGDKILWPQISSSFDPLVTNARLDMRVIIEMSDKLYLAKKDTLETITVFSESDSLLEWVADLREFFQTIGQDSVFYSKKTEIYQSLMRIKKESMEIIKGIDSEEGKISAIYSWMRQNIPYDKATRKWVDREISDQEYKTGFSRDAHSGLALLETRKWTCQSISILFDLMLKFAGINGARIEDKTFSYKGTLLPHAWNRIGDFHYDITLDLETNRQSFYKLTEEELEKVRKKALWQ